MCKNNVRKTFMLVVVDRFSKWVETLPSKEQSAATVIKILTREVMEFRRRYVQTMVQS